MNETRLVHKTGGGMLELGCACVRSDVLPLVAKLLRFRTEVGNGNRD